MTYPNVGKLYQGVIDDVINGVREAFLDESVDEQILQELKQLWESKVNHHKAVSDGPRQQLPAQPVQQQQQAMLVMDGGRHDRLHHPVLPQQRAAGPQSVPTQVVFGLQSAVPLDLSGAATTAAMALPSSLYQLGGFTLQQNTQGQLIAVPTGLPIVQIPGQLPGQLEPQNLSKPKDASGGIHVVQLDGKADDDTIGRGSNDLAAGGDNTIGLACSRDSTEPKASCSASTCLKRRHRRIGKPVEITIVLQSDGAQSNSSSDDDDDEEDDGHGVDDDNADAGDDDEVDGEAGSNDEKPLNSDDDVDDGASDLFDTENLIVCQFDKINRSKSKWKFHLKDGIMNLKGKDYVFHKATGEAEW